MEAFVPQMKNLAEMGIEKTFNDKVSFSIGSIDGGVFRPFVFNDIKIEDKKGTFLFSSVDINSIRTDYRIWDFLFSVFCRDGKGGPAVCDVLSGDSSVYINFVTKNGGMTGFVKLEGSFADADVKGYVNLPNKEKVDFVGKVKDDSFDIEIRPAAGTLKAKGALSSSGVLDAKIRVEHIQLYGCDIVCDLNLKNRIEGAGGGVKKAFVEGEVDAENLVVNFRPLFNAKASYRYSGGMLEIPDFSFGEIVKARAKIFLSKPYNVDAVFTANNVSLTWLFANLGVKDPSSMLSGTLNGKFAFKGKPETLKTDIRMEIRNGTIATLDFKYLTASFTGDGPIMHIEDSRITRESGYFTLSGEMDLRKIGRNDLFAGIKILNDDQALSWDVLETTKLKDAQEIRMTKKIDDVISLDFKKFIAEEKMGESIGHTDEVQLEYKLHQHESLKMMLGQDEDFLGFEHKDKF